MANTDVSGSSDPNEVQDENDVGTEICNVVSRRASEYRNSVLASQIQKALPVTAIEKSTSLHLVLEQLSEESLKKPEAKQNLVTVQIPKRSIYTLETTVEEYTLSGDQDELLADSFVRNLAIPFREKVNYRNSLLIALKRKKWYTKLCDFVAKRYENFVYRFEFWYNTLNTIEGQHGTAVVSYFLFLRWLLYMNIGILLLNLFFLVLPQCMFTGIDSVNLNHTAAYFTHNAVGAINKVMEQCLKKVYYQGTTDWKGNSLLNLFSDRLLDGNITNTTSVDVIMECCKQLYSEEIAEKNSTGSFVALQNLLQGTGPLEPTVLFTGFYHPLIVTVFGNTYRTSFAFLCVLLATFIGCFIMMIHYSSVGIQEAFMARNRESNYSNKVLSAWEFCIKDPKSAELLYYRFFLEMKTNLHEDRVTREITTRSTKTWVKLYAVRFLINTFIVMWLFSCCYLIYSVTTYQLQEQQQRQLSEPGLKTLFVQFLPSLTIIVLNGISPTIFKILIIFENYSAQTEANLSIFRNVCLLFASIVVLLNTFYQEVACKPKDICGMGLSEACRSPRCWETYVGQQLFKLTLTDVFVNIGVFLCNDALKYYISKNCSNKCTKLWGNPVFFLPTEILAAVNSQTITWLGVFYCPLLPVVMILKLIIIFYVKKTKILKFCEPSETSYRASKFNAVFIIILLLSFFMVLIVQSFAIERIPPSRGCGPFRHLDVMIKAVPESIRSWLSVLMSYWVIFFTTLLLCLAIHYYWREIVCQKEILKKLKSHIVLCSYDKQFLLKSIAKLTNDKSSKVKKTDSQL